MSIAAIIEKYKTTFSLGSHSAKGLISNKAYLHIDGHEFPAIEKDITELMQKEAVAFLTWARFSLKNTPLGMVIIEDKEVPKKLYDEGEIYQYYLTNVKK